MSSPPLSVVTGAFGYTGRYITRLLLEQGETVRTLTRSPAFSSPFGDRVETRPLNFDDTGQLAESLKGADTLYNTYWIRFARGGITHDVAVGNTRTLLRAATEAGVRRVVHISITNASEDSPLPYFRGKALGERAVRESGLSYAILRPTQLFGYEDILINNIAWFLRRFPVFLIGGSGDYLIQPVSVKDVANLAVAAAGDIDDTVIDAVGPETFTFEELVRLLAKSSREPLSPAARAALYRDAGSQDHGRLASSGRGADQGRNRRPDGGTLGLSRTAHRLHPLHRMAGG